MNADHAADFPRRFPFAIELDRVLDVKRYAHCGPVYNLKTTDGWYVADGYIVSNCYYEYIYNLIDLPQTMLTEKAKTALQIMEESDAEAV